MKLRDLIDYDEQVGEALLPKQKAVADRVRAADLAANKEKSGHKFGKKLRADKVASREKTKEVGEALPAVGAALGAGARAVGGALSTGAQAAGNMVKTGTNAPGQAAQQVRPGQQSAAPDPKALAMATMQAKERKENITQQMKDITQQIQDLNKQKAELQKELAQIR
jgi:hypothetical protein